MFNLMAFKGGKQIALLLLYAVVEVSIYGEEILSVFKMPPSLTITPHVSLLIRKATVFTFPPAFIICLVHGLVSQIPVPALGLIPMFFSALLGAFLMYRDQITFGGSPITLTKANVLFADLTLGVSLLVILILSWIFVPVHRYHGGEVMLGTYATVPLMANL